MIELLWNAPVSESKMAAQIAALDLAEGDRILDVGCGCGEVLLRICERHRVQATGIDSSGLHVDEARRRAALRDLVGSVDFIEADAQRWHVEPGSHDTVLCLGASHAFGLGPDAYTNALQQIVTMVRSGGKLLISEAYARQPIPNDYREFIGDSIPDETTHAGNVHIGESLGLIPLGAWTSNVDEWDTFEWNYQRIVETKAMNSDADKEDILKLKQRRNWMDGYLRWGRDTLGYGTYLFIKRDSNLIP